MATTLLHHLFSGANWANGPPTLSEDVSVQDEQVSVPQIVAARPVVVGDTAADINKRLGRHGDDVSGGDGRESEMEEFKRMLRERRYRRVRVRERRLLV